ncbi:hypothetical protein DUNSADRAFT_5196 [Dunaliella salina]|nr:hypothetical protein DUNSADRAFT_5196 [Dunaliella salina]|eukprot:KAF5836967.1 hypothetical protein DUNSADRAFT_5196 [Dunaliella salina]
MEEDVSIVCAFVQGLLRSHGLQPQPEQPPATASTQAAPAAATSSSAPLAPLAAAPEPASPSISARRPWTAGHAHSAARCAAFAPSTSARGAWGRGGRSRIFAGDEDFEFEDDDQYGGSSRRHASGAVTSFEDGLRPFLGDRTQHFMHELRNFAASHLTIQAYDSAVVYQPGPASGSHSAMRQQVQHSPAAPPATAPTPLPGHQGTNASAARPATAPTPLPGHQARMRLRGWDVGPTSSTSVLPSITTHQLHPSTDTDLRPRSFSGPPLQHMQAHAAADRLSQSQLPQSTALRTASEWEEAAEAPLGVNPPPQPPQSTAVQTAAAWEEAAEAPLRSIRPSGVPGVPLSERNGAVRALVPAHRRRRDSAEDTRGGEDTPAPVRGLGRSGGIPPLSSAATAGRKRARSPSREAREGSSRRRREGGMGLRLGGAEEQACSGLMQRRSGLTQRRQSLEGQITEVRRRRETEEQDEELGRGREQRHAGQQSGEGRGVDRDQEEERDDGMVGLQELRQRALQATASLAQRRRQLAGQQGATSATGSWASSRDVGSDRWEMS